MKLKAIVGTMLGLLLTSVLTAASRVTLTVEESSSSSLALYPSTISWIEGAEPMTYPYFDVKVNITDVADLSGVCVSVHWDPTILNCTMPDGVTPGFTAGDFLPVGPPDATGWMISWDFDAGNLSEACNTMMSGKPLRTVTKPDWGWVFTLTFKFIGTPPPSIWSPIDTDILIVNDPDHYMTSCWVEAWGPYYDFQVLGGCHFQYTYRIADITGPDGVPDGVVDIYDLARVAKDYGKEAEP